MVKFNPELSEIRKAQSAQSAVEILHGNPKRQEQVSLIIIIIIIIIIIMMMMMLIMIMIMIIMMIMIMMMMVMIMIITIITLYFYSAHSSLPTSANLSKLNKTKFKNYLFKNHNIAMKQLNSIINENAACFIRK